MIDGAGIGGIVLRQGPASGLPGAVPLPQEPPLPGEQARFESLLAEPDTQPDPAQTPGTFPLDPLRPEGLLPPEPAAGLEKTAALRPDPAAEAVSGRETGVFHGLSGDSILASLDRMRGPSSAGVPLLGGIASPDGLIAVHSSLIRGATAMRLMSRVQSESSAGLEQVTRGS